MNFSEQLDKFVERGAEKHEHFAVERNIYRDGASSLKPIALKLQQEMYSAYNYLKGFDCDKHCDPSVDFHDPLCCIEQSFSKALAEVERMIGGDND